MRRMLCWLMGHHYKVAVMSCRRPLVGVVVCTCCGEGLK